MTATLADRWADTMRTARTLDPERIARAITQAADSGLRASRPSSGGRTTFVACEDPERCDDGPDEHRHQLTADPTGNAAVRGARTDRSTDELRRLNRASIDMVRHATVVLDWVAGKHPATWADVLTVNAALRPGTIQAGIDVDDERIMPRAIEATERAVETVAAIGRRHLPRDPSIDEEHWTAGLADEDVCTWHLSIHLRYRRPKVGAYRGERICADCMQLVLLADTRPPQWLLEAEVDRLGKPRAWQAALGRWMDELGVAREAG